MFRTTLLVALLSSAALAAMATPRTSLVALPGSYQLSDGRVLLVARVGQRLVAGVDGARQLPLEAVAPNVLRSPDGSMTLEFDTAPNGAVHELRLTQPRR